MKIGAIILAAGFGTRLSPLTDHTPKPLLAVGGKPVVSHLVERLREVDGLTQVIVVVNDRHLDQWHDWRNLLPASPNVRIVSNGVITDQDRVGAVADLAIAVTHLEVDWFVVVAGDNLLDESLQPHINAAIGSGHPLVLCRDLGHDVPPGRFGEITINETGIITRFREKPDDPQSPLAATCTYVLPGEIVREVASYLDGGDADSPGNFVGWLATRRPVLARTLTGRYFDIGNHQTLGEARAAYDPPPTAGKTI